MSPYQFVGALVSSLILTAIPNSNAATYYWDANVDTAGNQHGSGTWNSTNTNWTQVADVASASPNVSWVNSSHTAYLGTTNGYTNANVGGTITLGEDITLGVLEKSSQAGAYTVSGNGHVLTLVGALSYLGNNATSATSALTVDAVVAGTEGLRKTLGGTVILTQSNTYSGGTTIATNATDSTSKSSVLQIGNGGTTGSLGEGEVKFLSAGASSGQSVLAFNRSDEVELSQELRSDTAGPNLGILRQAGTGTLWVASENLAFTGGVEVLSGTLVVGDGQTAGSLGLASSAAISSGATLAFDRSDTQFFNALISGAGAIEKRNTGILLFGGTGSTHTGALRVLSGTVGLLNDQALSASTELRLSNGAIFDVGEHTQQLANVVVESGAVASIQGTGTLQMGTQSVVIGSTTLRGSSTLDLRGLSNFNFNGGTTYDFTVGGNISSNESSAATTTGILYLADHNVINALKFNVGTVSGGGGSPKNAGYLYLGKTNTITASEVSIGGTLKNEAGVQFRSDVTDGVLTIRGTNAFQRATLYIGRHNSGYVSVEESYLDTTAGTLDALLGTVLIGHNQDAASPAKGRFSMGAGTMNATHLVIGRRSQASTANTSAVFELKGGSVKVDNITMGDALGTATTGKIQATFRLFSGQLAAKTLNAGAGLEYGVRKLEWTSGVITNFDSSSNFSSTGVDFHFKNAGEGVREFNVATNRTMTIEGNFVNETGTASYQAFTKKGNGTLILGGTVGGMPIVKMQGGNLRLNGSNLLGTGGALEFSTSGKLELQGHQQTLSDLKIESGAQVVVEGTTGSGLHLVGGAGTMVIGGSAATSLDMSSLSDFSFTAAGRSLIWGGQENQVTSSATIKLASENNTIVAKALALNSVTSGETKGQNRALVELGRTNTLHIDTFTIGAIKSSATLTFASGITDGQVTIRNTAGTGRASMTVGDNKSSALMGEALVDFSSGTVDAMFDGLKIGNNTNEANQNKPTIAAFKMTKGTVDVTTLTLGAFNGPSGANMNEASNRGEGTFELKGTGTLKVDTLRFAEKNGTGIGFASGILDLETGTLKAASINKFSTETYGTASFLWRSGTVQNYDANKDLTIQNVNLTLASAAGARTFQVDANRKIVLHSSLVDGAEASTIGFTKSGAGRLELMSGSTYAGRTKVAEGTLFVGNTTGSATGQGAVEVSLGAALKGNGILKPTGNQGISLAGLLEVGDTNDTAAKTLSFDLSETTGAFVNTGTVAITLFSNAGDNSSILTSSDRVKLLGIGDSQIHVGGSLLLSLGNGDLSFAEGDRWKIFELENNSVATLGSFNNISSSGFSLASGLTWNVERDLQGIYAVVAAVPEPSRLLLVGLSVLALGFRRRRC